MAVVLGVNRKTIVRKFLFVAAWARSEHERRIARGEIKTSYAQFDEMETFEHTRLKPISVALGVRAKTGQIVDIRVAQLGYKGPLAELARRKYGPREDLSHLAVNEVLSQIGVCSTSELRLVTDASTRYPRRIRACVPHAVHVAAKVIVPEVKPDRRNYKDPLFTLNYTAAKIRNDLSRMSRKTWVTTKKIDRLQAHLDLYIAWNNGYRLRAAA